MTLNEFKAWLEGFEHSIQDDAPTAEQWKAIRDQLANVIAIPPMPTTVIYPQPQIRPVTTPYWPHNTLGMPFIGSTCGARGDKDGSFYADA